MSISCGSAWAATIDVRTTSSANDAEQQADGSVNLSSSDLELTEDSSVQTVGMRWTGITIPPNATIVTAYIQFTSKEVQTKSTSLLFRGDASVSAAPFTTVAGSVGSRVFTDSSQSWAPDPWAVGDAGVNQRTPELKALIQNIVNLPGWLSGNPLAIIATGIGHRTAYSFDGSSAASPLLHIEFNTAPPPENPPVAQLSVVQSAALTVRADASGSTDIDSTPITSYEFDFGDGFTTGPSGSPTATHLYATGGTYSVSVTVSDAVPSSSTDVKSITVTSSTAGSFDKRVAASSDDAEQPPTGSVGLTSSDLELIQDNTTNQVVGLRWTNVTIPLGAQITAATVQFSAKESQNVATALTIWGEKNAAPATFTSTAGGVWARPRTTASKDWSALEWISGEAGSKQLTPDLSEVIQEIVSQGGWASGNPLALIVNGTGHRTAYAFDGSATAAPLLHVEYLVGPPPPDFPPSAALTVTQVPSPPLTVTADASGSTDSDRTGIRDYWFDFGDGATLGTTAAIVTHRYPDVATYTVRLVVTDTGNNASDTLVRVIDVLPPPDFPPVAALSVTQVASPPLTVFADASASTDSDATGIVTYYFDFGDGAIDTTSSSSRTHTYGAEGTYTVSLVAEDAIGQRSTPPVTVTLIVNAGYPAFIEKRVSASSDDAEQPPTGSVNVSSSDLELVQDSVTQTVGLRWTGITIPPQARITNAYVQFSSKELQAVATDLVFQGQLGNAAAFTSTAGSISARSKTTSNRHWLPSTWPVTAIGPDQRTPDLSAIIQEIVNGSWVSGNALALIVTGSGHRTAWSYDGRPLEAPLLHIDYLSPTPVVDDPPVASLSVSQVATPPRTILADASGSTDTDATGIQSYNFNFGDGATTGPQSAPTATHTYATAGTRVITVTVTDAANKSSQASTSFDVADPTTSSGVAVYVGYYDTHHSSHLKTKPSPWVGGTNLTFVGSPDPGTTNGWDSSCIRIDNLGTSSLTVSVTVNMGSKSFALWSSQTIAAGKTLILAQTGFENFDGSDTSPAGCYGCNPNLCLTQRVSTKPVVHVTITSHTTDYVDTGQIMNTGGYDGAGCPDTGGTRNDESSPWTRIFPAAAAAAANLEPAEETHAPVAVPRPLALAPLFPNPTHGDLGIGFSLPKRGAVKLELFDVMGRSVKTYFDGVMDAGEYRGQMNLAGATAGMYFVRLWTPEGTLHREFVLTP